MSGRYKLFFPKVTGCNFSPPQRSEDLLLAGCPTEDDLKKFENLQLIVNQTRLSSSPDQPISEWEATPVVRNEGEICSFSWAEVQQILLWTGRSRARKREKS
jgi:hypothetical protein